MTTQPDYLRYLTSAKQAEVGEQFRQQGYRVEEHKYLGDAVFDLLATKAGTGIVCEFRYPGERRFSREERAHRQQLAAQYGYTFRTVVAVPPRRTEVEVAGLEDQLLDHFTNHFPGELDALSSHTQLDQVADVIISSIRVTEGEIHLSGSADITVGLNYGNGSDACSGGSETFPFTFSAVLDSTGKLKTLSELEIDTSDFNE